MALLGVEARRLMTSPLPKPAWTPSAKRLLTWARRVLESVPVALRLAASRTRRVSRGFTTHVEQMPAAAPAATDAA